MFAQWGSICRQLTSGTNAFRNASRDVLLYDIQSGNLFFLRRKEERISGIASKMLACGVKYAKKTAPAGAAFFLERDKVSPRGGYHKSGTFRGSVPKSIGLRC